MLEQRRLLLIVAGGIAAVKDRIEQYMSPVACGACGGARLKPTSLAVTVGGRSIHDLTDAAAVPDTNALDHLRTAFPGAELVDDAGSRVERGGELGANCRARDQRAQRRMTNAELAGFGLLKERDFC